MREACTPPRMHDPLVPVTHPSPARIPRSSCRTNQPQLHTAIECGRARACACAYPNLSTTLSLQNTTLEALRPPPCSPRRSPIHMGAPNTSQSSAAGHRAFRHGPTLPSTAVVNPVAVQYGPRGSCHALNQEPCPCYDLPLLHGAPGEQVEQRIRIPRAYPQPSSPQPRFRRRGPGPGLAPRPPAPILTLALPLHGRWVAAPRPPGPLSCAPPPATS